LDSAGKAQTLKEPPQQKVLSSSNLPVLWLGLELRVICECCQRLMLCFVTSTHIGERDGLKPAEVRQSRWVVTWERLKRENGVAVSLSIRPFDVLIANPKQKQLLEPRLCQETRMGQRS